MPLSTSVVKNFDFSLDMIRGFANDIENDQFCEQPTTLNHPAWQIGHIVFSLKGATQLMGGSVTLPAGWDDKFGIGSTVSPDRAAYPDKEALIKELNAIAEQVRSAGRAVSDEQLASPNPNESFRAMMPTVGDAVTFLLTTHLAFHVGQVSAWRRTIGLGAVAPG